MAIILGRKPGGAGGGGGAPSGPAGGSLTGTYPDPGIANLAVDTAQIADDAVDADKIDGADAADIRTLLSVPSNAEAVLDTIFDAKGDLLVATAADTPARIAVGATNGMVLEVASGASPGVQWDLPPGYEYDYVEYTSTTSVTATSSATAQTIVTNNAVVLDGSTKIRLEFYSPLVQTPGGATNRGTLIELFGALNGGAAASLGVIANPFSSSNISLGQALIAVRYLTPASGSWVYSWRAYVTAGTGSVTAGNSPGAGAYPPGYGKISKA